MDLRAEERRRRRAKLAKQDEERRRKEEEERRLAEERRLRAEPGVINLAAAVWEGWVLERLERMSGELADVEERLAVLVVEGLGRELSREEVREGTQLYERARELEFLIEDTKQGNVW